MLQMLACHHTKFICLGAQESGICSSSVKLLIVFKLAIFLLIGVRQS